MGWLNTCTWLKWRTDALVDRIKAESKTPGGAGKGAETQSSDQTLGALYRKAFGHIPYDALVKIAECSGTIDKTVRGLLISLLADPQDKACWSALIDHVLEFVSRPNEVEFEGRKIATSTMLDFKWWSAAIDAQIAQDLMSTLGQSNPTTAAWASSRNKLLSLDALCAKTPDEILKIPGIKAKRLKKIQLFLGRLGLHLAGDQTHSQPDLEQKESTDDYGSGSVSGGSP